MQRVNWCLEPHDALHDLPQTIGLQDFNSHLWDRVTTSARTLGLYEIGHVSIPARQLVGRGQHGWFELMGIASNYDTGIVSILLARCAYVTKKETGRVCVYAKGRDNSMPMPHFWMWRFNREDNSAEIFNHLFALSGKNPHN